MIYIPENKKVLIAHHGMTLTCEEDCAMLQLMCQMRGCKETWLHDISYSRKEIKEPPYERLFLVVPFKETPNGKGLKNFTQMEMSKQLFSTVWTAFSLTMYALENKFDVVIMPDRILGPKVIEHIAYLSFVSTRSKVMVQFPFANQNQQLIEETYDALKDGKYIDPTIPKEAPKPDLKDLKPHMPKEKSNGPVN